MFRSIVPLRRPRLVAGAVAVVVSLAAWQTGEAQQPRLARVLVDALESRFDRTEVDDWRAITGLVIAGGNHLRIHEGLRLAREHPHLHVVLTGPSEEELRLAQHLATAGDIRLTIEPQALNTFGNALYSKALIGPRPGERWLLVTSASHMPRAIGSFWRVGFMVEPWPVMSPLRTDGSVTYVARHEWLGLLAYWVRGRTVAVFPSAADLAHIAPPSAAPRI